MIKDNESLPLILGAIAVIISVLMLGIYFPNPNPPSPAPQYTSRSIEQQYVEIAEPKDGDAVSWRHIIEDKSSATVNSGLKVYVLIWPIESNGPWWVQPSVTYSDGSWESYAYFGRDPGTYPQDFGTTYRVVAVITNESLKQVTIVDLLGVPRSARSKTIIVKRN